MINDKKIYEPQIGDIVSINNKYGCPFWENKIGQITGYHEYDPEVAKLRDHSGFFTLKIDKKRNPVSVYKHQIDFIEHEGENND